jgi:septum site-determining protein MinC
VYGHDITDFLRGKEIMEKGYVENGFIVDLSHAQKISQVIYELSAILDLPDAQEKEVFLKLGALEMTKAQLLSVKAMVESMGSTIDKISSSSNVTIQSAKDSGIDVTEIENVVPTIAFDNIKPEVNKELEVALDKIFGDDISDISQIHKDINEPKEELKPEEKIVQANEDFSDAAAHDEINKVIEDANNTDAIVDITSIENETEPEKIEISEEVKKHLRETEQLPTLYIQRTLRSGQSLKSEGNIVIIGDVNPGSEIIATGDITVWGILGGIAHAGCDGNTYARVRALKMNPIQLRIADILARRPDTANVPYIQKTDTFVPEEAIMRNNKIVIHKSYEN